MPATVRLDYGSLANPRGAAEAGAAGQKCETALQASFFLSTSMRGTASCAHYVVRGRCAINRWSRHKNVRLGSCWLETSKAH
jgi:hypothetical protein